MSGVRHILLLLAGLAVLLPVGAAAAQTSPGVQLPPSAGGQTGPGESWAVLIGINRYQHPRIPKLRAAVNDAQAVERALLAQGFRHDRILALTDEKATKAAIERLLGDQLRQQVGPNDRLLVFFAGHGKTDQLRSGEEEGYLIPVDGDPAQLFSTAISMTALRQISDRLNAKHILYIVDACYSGYAIYNRSISEDLLEEMVKKPAIQILTAGRQQDEAQERAGHGVFTEVLVRGLSGEAFTPGKSWLALEELGLWMKQRVFAESNKKQLPQYGNLSGEGQFVFRKAGPALGALAVAAKLPGVEVWLGDRRIGDTTAEGELVVTDLPVGTYRLKARKAGHPEWERSVEIVADRRIRITIEIEDVAAPKVSASGDGVEMVFIPAGEFWMGATEEAVKPLTEFCKQNPNADYCQNGQYARDELPRHRVALAAFYLDRFEVTNAWFEKFVKATGHRTLAESERESAVWLVVQDGRWQRSQIKGANWRAPNGPGSSAEPTHPVVQVSWFDAVAYCEWAGKRLPTEAEWEKAARGADGYHFPWGNEWDPTRANVSRGVNSASAPVGTYPQGASPYGVQDMAGNVWEWVADWYDEGYYGVSPAQNPPGPTTGKFRIARGGSWLEDPLFTATTRRFAPRPSYRSNVRGFRCARNP
jgi:formylglycine-generating enzyme required for sulfatase activity